MTIRYLLDTNHATAHWRSHPSLAPRLAAQTDATAGLCIPSIGELWFMVYNSAKVDQNRQSLITFMRSFEIWPFNSDSAIEFGRIKAELRKTGRPIPDVDVQIAAIARLNDLTLLSADRHFTFVQNLKVENWLNA